MTQTLCRITTGDATIGYTTAWARGTAGGKMRLDRSRTRAAGCPLSTALRMARAVNAEPVGYPDGMPAWEMVTPAGDVVLVRLQAERG